MQVWSGKQFFSNVPIEDGKFLQNQHGFCNRGAHIPRVCNSSNNILLPVSVRNLPMVDIDENVKRVQDQFPRLVIEIICPTVCYRRKLAELRNSSNGSRTTLQDRLIPDAVESFPVSEKYAHDHSSIHRFCKSSAVSHRFVFRPNIAPATQRLPNQRHIRMI